MSKKIFFIIVIFLCFTTICSGEEPKEKLRETPSWRGLTPGKSTSSDAIKVLGKSSHQYVHEGKTYLNWDIDNYEKGEFYRNMIATVNDIITHILIREPDDFERDPDKLFAKYGRPVITVHHKNPSFRHGPPNFWAVYPEIGISFMIDQSFEHKNPIVATKRICEPMTVEACKKEWEEDPRIEVKVHDNILNEKFKIAEIVTPSWRGLMPEKSTYEDVIRILGEPDFQDMSEDGEEKNLYWYVDDKERHILSQNLVVVKEGVISTILIAESNDFITDFDKLFTKYGWPMITLSFKRKGSFDMDRGERFWWAAYPNIGTSFFIHENIFDETAIVEIKKIYEPMTVKAYKSKMEKNKDFKIMMHNAAPYWRGIVPGRSNVEWTIYRLGEPHHKRTINGKLIFYYKVKDWEKRGITENNTVAFVDDIVEAILIAEPDDFNGNLDDIIKEHGDDYITEIIPNADRKYFITYPDKGIAFLLDKGPIAGFDNKTVSMKKLFKPMSIEEYKKKMEESKVERRTFIE